jgi:O-antigen/teichoic acid export membrane protein
LNFLPPFLRAFESRLFAYVTMEDRFFSGLLSPAIMSLRLSGGFVRSVLVLLSGSTIAMVVPVAAAPFLTRLYTPHDYGVFALYVSIVTVFSVPLAGGYDMAVMLPRKDEEAFNLAAVSVAISMLVCMIFFLAPLFFAAPIGVLLGSRHITALLWSVPLVGFLMSLQQVFSSWVNRKRQFKRLASSKVAEAVVSPAASIGLGMQAGGVGGLVAGLVGGKLAALWLVGRSVRHEKKTEGLSLRIGTMLEQARKYRDFPVYSAPTSFLDVLALQIPVFFLARFFDTPVVGWFALTTRIIGAPLALIGSCVSQVFYQWIAEAGRENSDLRSHTARVALYLAMMVSGPLLIAAVFSPILFSLVFGEQWRVAGEYARILMFPLAIKFVVSPLSVAMPASGNIKLGSIWKIAYFSSTAVVLYIAAHFTPWVFFFVYSAHELVFYGLYFLLILRVSADLRPQVTDADSGAPDKQASGEATR